MTAPHEHDERRARPSDTSPLYGHCWDDVITAEDRAIYRDYVPPPPPTGKRLALLLVDVYNQAFGDRPQPIHESRKRFPSSCGLAAWDALGPLRELLACARRYGLPVVYSTKETRPGANAGGSATNRNRYHPDSSWAARIIDDLKPEDDEFVVHKMRASVFFGTPLESYLRRIGIDALVVAGETTSGCVRASVVDAYSHGFHVAVVEDATFDRSVLSHKVNLFDMHHKYARCVRLKEALDVMESAGSKQALQEQKVPRA